MKNKFFDLKMNANTPKTLDLYIYTDVESDYWDWWTGEQVESQTSAEHIRKELEAAGDVTQINIYINSLGGSVMEGMSIYNQLRRHKAHKTVYIDGFACSVASVIAMAGDEVVIDYEATYAKLLDICKQHYCPYTESFEGTVAGDVYRGEWQLGDYVTVEDAKRGTSYKKQVEEVTEVFEAGSERVDVTLGPSLKTVLDLIREAKK